MEWSGVEEGWTRGLWIVWCSGPGRCESLFWLCMAFLEEEWPWDIQSGGSIVEFIHKCTSLTQDTPSPDRQ